MSPTSTAADRRLLFAGALFATLLLLAWLSHGRGIIRDDPQRNIVIPQQLLMPLTLQAAYNEEEIWFRYRWPAERPHIAMDMLRFDGQHWQRHGTSPVGQDPDGLYEDRLTMLVDDGRVAEFRLFGGYITAHGGQRFMSDAVDAANVRAHPHLGATLGASDVRKYLPATRQAPHDWDALVDADTLARQRQAGYFLDLWHWRAHRSNPVGMADDQHVAEYRLNDSGRGTFSSNQDSDTGLPHFMFDPSLGQPALRWSEITTTTDFDSRYFLSRDQAVPFDPQHPWQVGDTLPRLLLQHADGSRGAIRVVGSARWQDGHWELVLARALDTGFPLEDKILHDQGSYDLAVAVHRDASGSRWHYVSLPFQLGLGRDATLRADRFAGSAPDWSQRSSLELTLFYPGQVTYASLLSRRHAGAKAMRQGIPARARHSEQQLAHYAVEGEFRQQITRQWLWTLSAGLLLIVGFAATLFSLLPRPARSTS
ncbi:hypothetical protein K8B33_09530 [Alcanivorax sp. JB21]|uniref:ethylbenzene dehydrogenase-related protein n=1 Tax=Alcanivorax limicola TaxID=2874102 RepID=UPI001CC15996|nr:ethylbenzene dehydrogenase-related protein [Alcanivorax limicola]MBZ2189338.1 hypothetical protein [Alcanivorax limicola]